MTQLVRVTGGYVGEVSGRVVDKPEGRDPADLSLANIKVMLLKVGSPLPSKNDAAWVTPTSVIYPENGVALVTLSVSSGDPGRYWFYALPSISPLAIPVRASNEQVELI